MATVHDLFNTQEPDTAIVPSPPIKPPDISTPGPSVDNLFNTDESPLFGKDKAVRNLNIAKTLKLNPQKEAEINKKVGNISFLRAAEDTITTSPDIPSNIPPGVLQHLSLSPSHAAISGDDIPGLSKVELSAKKAKSIKDNELSWWDRFTHNLKFGSSEVIKNSLGSIRAFSDLYSEVDKLAIAAMPEESRKAELDRRKTPDTLGLFPLFPEIGKALTLDSSELEKVSSKTREAQKSEFLDVVRLTEREGIKGWYDDLVIMGPQIVAQVFTNAVFGPETSAAFMASQIGGGQFTQLKDEGVDSISAFSAAAVNTITQLPLEMIGLGRAMRLWKPGKTGAKIAREIIGAMGTEFVTEWLQQYPEAATDIWARAQEHDVPLSEQVDIFFKEFWNITRAGIYAGSIGMVYGGFTSAISTVAQVRGDVRWIERTQKINDAVNETETKALSPEMTKEFLDIVGVGEEVFLTSEGVRTLFQTDPEILEKLGVNETEINNAIDLGSDISFPESSLHSALSPEEFTLVKDHIKAAPGAFSASEHNTDLAVESIKRLDAVHRDTVENQKAFDTESARIKEQVISTGHTQEFADTYIDTVERFANRIALEGRDRVAFLEGINIQVKSQSESQQGRQFKQEGFEDLPVTEFGQQGLEFEQAEKKEPPRGKVNIDSTGYLVSLFQTRNMSTLIHETGHIFFEEMVQLADTGQASEQLVKDVETIRKWLELEPGQEFTDEHHEKFARGFEAYLLEGKAPSLELATMFARFKRWLSQVYKSVKELNVTLNADIPKVFDRMLISDAEIENSAELNGLVLDQEKMDTLGVVAEDQAFMKRLIETAQDKGKDGLQKDRNRGYRANIKKWRKEATAEIDARKEYQDVSDIVETGGMSREEYIFDYGTGELGFDIENVPAGNLFIGDKFNIDGKKNEVIAEDEEGNIIIENEDGIRIEFDAFDNIPVDNGLEGISTQAVEAQRLPDRRLLKKGARSIGTIALGHGYDNANSMIDTFHNMLPRSLAIQQLVNEQQAEFDAQFLAEDYLMGTKEFAEYLTILSKYLEGSQIVEAGKDIPTGKKSTKTISRQRFKAFAVETINAMSVRDARRTDRFMSAMRKAANQERKATIAGDFGKAAKANEKVRLNYELAGESIRIRRETDKFLRRSNRVVSAKLDNVFKQQVFKLLRRFNLTDRKFRIDETAPSTDVFFLDLQNKADDDLFRSVPVFDSFLMSDSVTDYRDLSVNELRQVNEMMGYLVKTGRDKINQTLADGKTLIETQATILSNWIIDHRKKDKKIISEEKKRRRVFSDFTRQYFAHSDELIFIMRSLDGFVNVKGQVGANEAFWNDQLKEAEAADQLLVKDITERIRPALDQLAKSAKKFPNKVDIPGVVVPVEMRKHGRVWNFHKILGVALNMGNTVNRQRIQTGYNVPFTGENQEGNTVEFSIPLTDTDLNRITQVLTKQDWQAVQEIWGAINSMWSAQARTFFALNGFHRPKIEADPFSVTAVNEDTGQSETVNLKGGYYHIEFDPELSGQAEEWGEKDDIINDTDALFPATSAKSGQMIERVKTTHMPVKLSLSVLFKHISIASRYINYAELLSDLSQVLRHPTYQNTIDQKAGVFVRKQLRPILSNIARPHDNMLDFIDGWLEREVGRATVNILGSTLDVPLKQAFSLPGFINDVGNQNFAKGMGIYINGILGENGVIWHPFQVWEAIKEMEPFMAQRSKSFDRELQTVFKKVNVDPKSLAGGFTANDIGAAFMSLIRVVDFATVGPAWWGAYQEGLIRFDGDSIEARKFATRHIRSSQPSALPVDKNHFQRSKKGWHRLATMFSSFAFKQGQRQRYNWNAWNNRDENGKRTLSSAKYFTDIMTEFIAPPLMMSVMFSLLRGEDVEPEDLLLDVLSYQFMGLFMVRDMTSWLAFSLKTGTRFGRDPFSSAAFEGGKIAGNMFLNIAELVGDLNAEKKLDAALLSFAEMIGYAYKAPVPKIAKRIVKGWEQYDKRGGIPTNILFPSHKR